MKVINLGPIALFKSYKLTTSNGKHLEHINHAHIVSLLYKLITSARGSDGLSIGFDRDRNRRQRELSKNKNQEGKYHVRIMLRDIIGFAEQQERGTYGLGYKLTITRNSDISVSNEDNGINKTKIKINITEWYVPQYTPSISNQAMLSKQILSKTPIQLQYKEKNVFMKEVNTHNFWTFELGTQEDINVPIWVIVGFQQKERENSQKINNDTFYRTPVTIAQCIIRTEKYPDSGIFLNYDDDDYCQGFGQNKEPFRILTKYDILNLYKTDHDFRSSSEGNNFGYKFYVSIHDIRKT